MNRYLSLNTQEISRFGRWLGLAASVGAVLAACSVAGNPDAEIGTASLAVVDVPSDVHCFQVTAQGASRTVVRSIDVTPGQTVQATLDGLPTGQVAFTGAGFNEVCAAVVATSVPGWISEPTTVTVQTSPIVDVELVLHRNGQASIGADFEDDPSCFPAGSMCSTDAECCTGQQCSSGVCSATPACTDFMHACATSSACCSGLACTGGLCLKPGQCTVDADCPAGLSCQANFCAPLQPMCTPQGAACDPTLLPCCGGLACAGGICGGPVKCFDDTMCPTGDICLAGACVPSPQCATDSNCPAGESCQGGVCVAPTTCTPPFLPCGDITMEPACCMGLTCAASGVCLPPGACNANVDCAANLICQGGACIVPACVPASGACSPVTPCCAGGCTPTGVCGCKVDTDCPASLPSCQAGTCSLPANCTTCAALLPLALSGNFVALHNALPSLCPGASTQAEQLLFSCACAGPCAATCADNACNNTTATGTPACESCIQTSCQGPLRSCSAS